MRPRPLRESLSFVALLSLCFVAAVLPADAQTVRADGRIVFASDVDGDWDVWAMNADGTGAVNLTSEDETGDGWQDHQPSWSPDGTRIVFSSTRGLEGDSEIYVMNADGTAITPVTSNPDGADFAPDWSADGTRIVFTSERASEAPDRRDDWDIYVIDVDGTNERNLTDVLESQPGQYQWTDKDPDWSPTSDSIVFASARVVDGTSTDGAYWRIVTMDPDGTNQRIVSNPEDPGNDPFPDDNPNHDEMPKWSPDGRWIVFATHQQPEQQWDVQIVRANGTDQQNVLPDEHFEDLFPTWSSKGTEVLFTSNRTGDHTRAIYSLDVSTFLMTPASASAARRTVGAAAPIAQSVQLLGGVGRSADPDLYARLRCTLRGTTHDDELLGTDERDVICARGGDDVIEGALGNDVVYAGPGSDRLFGRPGNDLLIGGAGSDVLNGGVGVDLCSDVFASAMVRCET